MSIYKHTEPPITTPLARGAITFFQGTLSHEKYWGEPLPQIWTIRQNLKTGNYSLGEDGLILVEYGWHDAMVTLKKVAGQLEFQNTISST